MMHAQIPYDDITRSLVCHGNMQLGASTIMWNYVRN